MFNLILDSTTKTIKANMSGAPATTNPDFTVAYADNTGTNFTEGANDGALNGTTDVTLVSAPASSTRRVIKSITIENRDTAAVTVTIKYDNNGTQRIIARVTLAVGDTWTTDGQYDTNGNFKQIVSPVSLTNASGTLATTNGGTGLTNFSSANNAIYSTSSSALTAGTLPVTAGGTGATTASTALSNLGAASTGRSLVFSILFGV